MADQTVRFASDGLQLSGVVRVPDDVKPGERRPAFIILHGFGGHKNSGSVTEPVAMFDSLGYVTLRFDMRGCGDSDGERGNLICLEQVSDTRNALTFLAAHPNVNPERIAVLGSSFGAAVAVYTGGVDERVAAVISASGWGNGETKFRDQHAGPGAYEKFLGMLEAGRRHRESTGRSLMVPRYEIVPIPPALRANIAAGSIEMFTAETAQSMFDFRAEDVIGDIAPRPTLLLHSAHDSVTPTQQSIDMFHRAKRPTDLHLFADTDHFMFAEKNARVRAVVVDWLRQYFSVRAT